LFALLLVERGAEGVVVLAGDPADVGEGRRAPLREMKRVRSPIVRILAALYEPLRLQLVHEGDEPARVDLEHGCELLLAQCRGAAQDPEDPGVRGRETERAQMLAESRCRVSAHLGE
jgi:hypothetical protein